MYASADLSWSSTASAGGTPDVRLFRDAANTLALRNGANAQTFRVYGSFTDASNNDYLEFTKAAGGVARIRAIANGTGSNTYLYLNDRWQIDGPSGHLQTIVDNTYDIGAAAGNRPRNLFLGSYAQMSEMTAPAAPAANSVRIYAEDNGSGKTRLMALFATGAAQQIAIEP